MAVSCVWVCSCAFVYLDVFVEVSCWMYCLDLDFRHYFGYFYLLFRYYCPRSHLHLQLWKTRWVLGHELCRLPWLAHCLLKRQLRYLRLYLLGSCWSFVYYFIVLLQQNPPCCGCMQVRRPVRSKSLRNCFSPYLANSFRGHIVGRSHHRNSLACSISHFRSHYN